MRKSSRSTSLAWRRQRTPTTRKTPGSGRACAPCRARKLRNGGEHDILDLGAKGAVRAEGEEPLVLKRGKLFRCARLRHAVARGSAQGLTPEGRAALHDTGHRFFGWHTLYVALSRAAGRGKVIVH